MFPVLHFIKNVKHTYYRQFTEVQYMCVPKLVKIDRGLKKLLDNYSGTVYLALHGTYGMSATFVIYLTEQFSGISVLTLNVTISRCHEPSGSDCLLI